MEDNDIEQNKEAIKQDAKGLWESVTSFLVELLDFRADTDRENTIEEIKCDIPFKGATAWILICSVFVASVGLNANSTAVVIGAMLISPLMGPILGIGLSIAINDIDTLKKSLINLTTMIVLSLLTAYLFFRFFPLGSEETSELLGRTKPDIRDVLIAFFGGLALIIARTKKGTIASVIFGVAIATALMPPLCTAGYALANQNWPFFIGAMNLFTINTIFIALATFIVLKLLRFPMLKYANSKKRKRIAQLASLAALIVMIYPGWTFWYVIKESTFNNEARKFVQAEFVGIENASYIRDNTNCFYNEGETPVIELPLYGSDKIPEETIDVWRARLQNYDALKDAVLRRPERNDDNNFEDNLRYMSELRSRDSLDLLSKNQKINFLEKKVAQLSKLEDDQIPFGQITIEAQINYENLKSLSYSKTLRSNFENIDTLTSFQAIWRDSIAPEKLSVDKNKLYKWLTYKLGRDTLLIDSNY